MSENINKNEQAATEMCARAYVALGVVIERTPASAAPEVREAFQGLRGVISSAHLYHKTLTTGSPSGIENWRRDGVRIRAEAYEKLGNLLDACFPSLGTEHGLADLGRHHQAEGDHLVEKEVGHGAG